MRRISIIALLLIWFGFAPSSYACSVEPLPWFLGKLEKPQLTLPTGIDLLYEERDDTTVIRITNTSDLPLYLAVPSKEYGQDPNVPSLDPDYRAEQYLEQGQLWMREYPLENNDWREIGHTSEIELSADDHALTSAGVYYPIEQSSYVRREGEQIPEPTLIDLRLVHGEQQIMLPLQITYISNPAYERRADPDAPDLCEGMMSTKDEPNLSLIVGITGILTTTLLAGWWYTRKQKASSA